MAKPRKNITIRDLMDLAVLYVEIVIIMLFLVVIYLKVGYSFGYFYVGGISVLTILWRLFQYKYDR